MKYEHIYPITHLHGQYLSLSWEEGFHELEVSYDREVIYRLPVMTQLVEKIEFSGLPFQQIELRLYEKKKTLDVIVDGLHSPANDLHPQKELRIYGVYFIFLAIISYFLIAQDLAFLHRNSVQIAVAPLVFVAIYSCCALFVFLGKPVAYWIGFSVFLFTFLLYIAFNNRTGLERDSDLLIRGFFAAIGAYGLRLPLQLQKYHKFLKNENEDLLDN